MSKNYYRTLFWLWLAIANLVMFMMRAESKEYRAEIARLKENQVIIYQVDNAGGMMVGKVTGKEIIDGRYTVEIGAYGKFLVSKQQYQDIEIGDDIPDYLKGVGS